MLPGARTERTRAGILTLSVTGSRRQTRETGDWTPAAGPTNGSNHQINSLASEQDYLLRWLGLAEKLLMRRVLENSKLTNSEPKSLNGLF